MKVFFVLLMLVGMFAFTAFAEEAAPKQDVENSSGTSEPGEDETAELARAAQNPVADLISLPFQ